MTTITNLDYLEIQNTCTCEFDDEYTECYGDCWEFNVETFAIETMQLFERDSFGSKYPFKVDGLPLWHGDVSGVALVENSTELLRAITVDAEWRLRYKYNDGELHCILSHHDVPTGRYFRVSPIDSLDYEKEVGY